MDQYAAIRCVEECERCHRTCLRTAMTYCLEKGVDEVEPAHFRALLTSQDPTHTDCALCARVCLQCAEVCERAGDLQDCVEACRRCARTCLDVSASPTATACR